jgi:DNA repair protein RadA/Sms
VAAAAALGTSTLSAEAGPDRRVGTGLPGVDRVLGGGLVPGSVALLAGEPGIGKSTLLLQLVSGLVRAGRACLVASGEESREQVAARAARLGVPGAEVGFVPGRDLRAVIDAAEAHRPFLLAVDSIQTVRRADVAGLPGGPAQVRACADALVELAKARGIAVLATGHVTKDGDLAGPRTLEHAVDVVLSFDGDPRSGLRVLSGGKNRFGPEGEAAWFEMEATGLREIEPSGLLLSGGGEAGAAVALPRAGRRALAVEVQALVSGDEAPPRREATGLDPRRFRLVAAVLERGTRIRLRGEVYGACAGGLRVDDPGADLAVAAALASAATGREALPASAFVGELALTGAVRPVPGMEVRLAAARAAGCRTVFAPEGAGSSQGVRVVRVRHVREVLAGLAERGPRPT